MSKHKRPSRGLSRREAAVCVAEKAMASRTQAADLRDRALAGREAAMTARAEAESQLREANESLVIATVNAQALTEMAEQATAEKSYMAEHDFLTGLPNRALLTDRLSQAIALTQRNGGRVALMYVDLDHFKHINDSLGHAVGDELLQSVTQRLQACVRLSDTVSRQGGDEFVVLLWDVSLVEDAGRAAEKLLAAMAEPHLVRGQRFHVTLSIGVSVFPDHGTDASTLLMNADTAMYSAKRSGRNGYRVFTPDLNVRELARHSVEQQLHHALEHDEFVLHYQPKVNLETGAITGAEALLRIVREGAVMPPAGFVRVAEECGLILPIGRWVLRQACTQAAAWLREGLSLRQVAVNVSSAEFHAKEFLAGLQLILKETGLDPDHLELELTESGLIEDNAATTSTLRALKAVGVHLAIDDFGTGYSSLSYLRRFPIDTLKIDHSFVQELDTGAQPIVSAVIAMGLSLNHRVVAEGIETLSQLAFLQKHHCSEGQGFLFSPPVSARVLGNLLRRAPSIPSIPVSA